VTFQEAKRIAQKALEGTATELEKFDLQSFINSSSDKDQLINSLFPIEDWERSAGDPLSPDMEQRLLKSIFGKKNRVVLGPWIRIAAAAVLIGISLAIWLLMPSGQSSVRSVTPTYTTVTTRNGQTKSILLEDGTRIVLNGGTTLRFPGNFSGHAREVYLDGEAYFDVSRDSLRPFIIHSPRLSTTVLGTSFSMRSGTCGELPAEIAVATGKVRVDINKDVQAVCTAALTYSTATVTAGEKVSFSTGDLTGLHKRNVNVVGIGAWKDHWFYYDQTPLKDILKDLERSYGLHFSIKEPAVLNCTYSTTFRNISTQSILQTLMLMGHVNFSIRDTLIEVRGKACP
jgi:transmembrane sensor